MKLFHYFVVIGFACMVLDGIAAEEAIVKTNPVLIRRHVAPLANAHSHNDYRQPHPLYDALDNGFCGVEADIYLVRGQLLVAHTLEETMPDKTLEHLYLEPLRERVRRNLGTVYPNGPDFILLIDIKSNGAEVWPVLKATLEKFKTMLTEFDGNTVKTNTITVVLSGDRPRALLASEKTRLAAYDGRVADLGTGAAAGFMPLISDNWETLFKWRGLGSMPVPEKTKLAEIVLAAHREGKKIRFWAAPDSPGAWAAQLETGVDLINTDDLPHLAKFLEQNKKQR